MKKLVTSIMAILYLGLTTGLAVNIHYCMGKVAEVAYQSYSNNPCACGDESDMPCCMHDYYLVKVSDEHQSITGIAGCKAPVQDVSPIVQTQPNILAIAQSASITRPDPPRLGSPPDLCIQNCVFRI